MSNLTTPDFYSESSTLICSAAAATSIDTNISLKNLFVEYSFPNKDFEGNPYEEKSEVTFYIEDSEKEEFIKIGYALFVSFNKEIAFEENFDNADVVSDLDSHLLGELYSMVDEGIVYPGDIYLDTINIEEKFRGNDYGTKILAWIMSLSEDPVNKIFLSTPVDKEMRFLAESFYLKFAQRFSFKTKIKGNTVCLMK